MEKDTVWGYEQESLQVECKPFLGLSLSRQENRQKT